MNCQSDGPGARRAARVGGFCSVRLRTIRLHRARRFGYASLLLVALCPVPGTAQPYAYITALASSADCNDEDASTDGRVNVIDTATNTLVTSVPVGDSPWGVAVNPGGTRVYVANRSDTVSVIDTATNTVAATIAMAPLDQPRGVAVNPAGTRLYVANGQSYTVSVIDTVTHAELARVPLANAPFDLAISPDGTKLYVSNGDVSVIDTSTNAVVTVLPYAATGLAINPAGTRLYVANHAQPYEVSVVDTSTNTAIATIPTITAGLWGLAVQPNGSRVYVAHESGGFVSVIDTTTNSVITTVSLGGGAAYGIAVDPQGARVYVANRFGDSVAAIDTVSNSVVDTVTVKCRPVAFGKFIGGPPTTSTVEFYLHGAGPNANPPTLFLDGNGPTATTPKYKDSAAVKFVGGNAWKEIGTWTSAAEGSSRVLTSLSELHAWVGLKNSDDQGTQFDVGADLYKNGALVASGAALCVTNVTRNPSLAKEVAVAFDAFLPESLVAGDVLSLRALTRIGTNPDGSKCAGPGGSHSNAVGLRLYFDATTRPSRFEVTLTP